MKTDEVLQSFKESIHQGWSWACNECWYADKNTCEIQKLAKEFDPNYKLEVFCRFDEGLVIRKIFELIGNNTEEIK